MAQYNIGCMLVQEDGKPCGILTDRDVALKVAGEMKDSRKTKVAEVMTPEPACISVDKDLHDLISLMHAKHIRRVPIVDGANKVLGIVTLDDLIGRLGDEMFEIRKTVLEAPRLVGL
jgi:CBS domain-containing protein